MRKVIFWIAGGMTLATICGIAGLGHLWASIVTLTVFCGAEAFIVLALGAFSRLSEPMRQVTTCAAALFVLTSGIANAEAIFHASPLPCVAMQGGGRFCGHTIDIRYQPGDGDQVLLRMHGYPDLQLIGLPSFVREVPTASGRLLRGNPKPGTYTVGVLRDGKRIPTLDMHMRFIQR